MIEGTHQGKPFRMVVDSVAGPYSNDRGLVLDLEMAAYLGAEVYVDPMPSAPVPLDVRDERLVTAALADMFDVVLEPEMGSSVSEDDVDVAY